MQTAGGPSGALAAPPQRWRRHRRSARVIRAVVLLAPVATSFCFTWLAAHHFPPHEYDISVLMWWIAVVATAAAIMVATERVTRRVLPLASLLDLGLIFPDEAPSRFGLALRTGTTRQLERRIEQVRQNGFVDDPDMPYAEQMLEMVASLSRHDRLTRGHCERVRAYADLIIDEMHIGEADAARLRWAALLHDVGKLLVPAEILNKVDPLTDDEFEIIKTHPDAGLQITEPIAEWLGEWVRAIGEHHERWDGNGYPNGLAATDIHLGARIVAVADAFDVMTSVRSYKKPVPHHEARAEIARCAGSQFDPEVARAFLNASIPDRRILVGPLTWLLNLPGVAAPLVPLGTPLASAAGAAGALALGVVAGPAIPAEPSFGIQESPPVAAVAQQPETTRQTTTPRDSTTSTTESTRESTTRPPGATPATRVGSTSTNPGVGAPPPGEHSFSLHAPGLSGVEDRPIIITVEATADERVEIAIAQNPAHGTVSEQTTATTATGPETITAASMVYTPDRDFSGSDSLRLRGCDSDACREVAVPIHIDGRNDAPVAGDDFATGPEDQPIVISFAELLENDRDVDSTPLRIELAAQPSKGRVQQYPGRFTFNPPPNWAGTTSFTYKVLDGAGGFDLAEVLIAVSARNDAPIARNETVSTRRNTPVTIAVLNNDVDPDGDRLKVSIEQSSNGTATVSNGRVVFTPSTGLIGTASVRYRISDPSGASATATATVQVLGPQVHLSRSANRASASPLAGQTVTGWVWIFTDLVWTSAEINTVEFRLDGVFVNTQGSPFYDFGKGPNYGLDTSTMTTGSHTITMKTRFRDGAIHQTDATFVVTR